MHDGQAMSADDQEFLSLAVAAQQKLPLRWAAT